MNIVFCAAECTPFAKVGGLGDVVGSLPKALEALGETVRIFLPFYGSIAEEGHAVSDTGIDFSLGYLDAVYPFRVLESLLPQSNIPVYFLDNHALFRSTDEIYPKNQELFEAQRLDIFAQAILSVLKIMEFQPDVLHVHDWHTARMAAWLKTDMASDSFYRQTQAVLSIHNMAYQGAPDGFNRLKSGLESADALVAVSPTYAKEILTPEDGCGLEDVLQTRPEKLSGILNGIDTNLFDPKTDQFLPVQYDTNSYITGKAAAKEGIQVALDLPRDPDVPLFGIVTRLVEQKGLDLLLPILPELAKLPAQFAILGSGEARYEDALKRANRETKNIRSLIGYHAALGQQIYAGSDAFLMPSRFEPCGLGQLIALRYGSVPVVRKTGGLADTISENVNGFVFTDYTAEAFLEAIERAIAVWQKDPQAWQKLILNGMSTDFSWQKSAMKYQQLYKSLI